MIINQVAAGGGGGIDTNDATAYPEHILEGYTAYARGAKITGTYGSVIIDEYTKLLLHFDGDFIDASGNTVFISGSPVLDASSYVFPPASASFGTTTDHLYLYLSEDTYFSDNDFTIDFWIYPTLFSGTRWIFIQRAGFKSEHSIAAYFTTDGKIRLVTSLNGSTLVTTTFNTPLLINTWQHIAIVRSANVVRCYNNGIMDPVTYSIGMGVIYRSTQPFRVGGTVDSNQSSSSKIDEFRISNGIARWTNNFAVPTEPYSIYRSETIE